MRKSFIFSAVIFLFIIAFSFAQNNNNVEIAKAGIKTVLNIDTKYIRTYKEKNKSIIVLQSLRTKSNYIGVVIEKNTILWRIEKDEYKNSPGRWRNSIDDGKLVYKLSGSKLIIDEIYSDGSVNRKTYNLSQF